MRYQSIENAEVKKRPDYWECQTMGMNKVILNKLGSLSKAN